jgi:hypothetical protein
MCRLFVMDFLEDETEGKENFLNEDVVELQRVWRNELNSVEILPFQQQLIEEISQLLIQQQVRHIRSHSASPGSRPFLFPLLCLIYILFYASLANY